MTKPTPSRRLIAALDARLAPLREQEDGTLYFEQSGPHYVVVTKEGDSVLLWLMDVDKPSSGVVQSELSLTDPLKLVDPYTQAMLLALLWNERPQRLFTTGLGGGCLPTLLHCLLPELAIDCVEIEPLVVAAAQSGFGFAPDEQLRVHIDDGRRRLAAAAPGTYDVILIDAFLDGGYTPYSMATCEFADLAHTRLSAAGVLVINLLYLGGYYAERIKSIAAVFPHLYLLRMGADNDLLFAAKSPMPCYRARTTRAGELEARLNLRFPLRSRARALAPLDPAWIPGWADAAVLHDATPPADYFAWLPTLSDPQIAPASDRPCLCGSGLLYGDCHGPLSSAR